MQRKNTLNYNDMEYTSSNNHWMNKFPNSDEPNMCRFFYFMLGIIIVLMVLLLFGSCQSVKYVPVETVKTEYISKTDTFIQKDSVHIKDSVFVTTRNDTVFVNKWHTLYQDKWRERIVCDTVLRADSIQVPYPVEKKLSRWEQIKMDAGGIAIGVCIVCIILVIVGFLVKAYRKT